MAAAARDVAATVAHACGPDAPTPSEPTALMEDGTAPLVLGHSFGGKVGLAYAAARAEPPIRTWLFDSNPTITTGAGGVGEVLAILDLEPALENAFDGGSFTVRFDSTRFDPETWWDMIEDDRKHEVVSGRDSGGDAVNRLLSCRFEFEVPIVPSDRP